MINETATASASGSTDIVAVIFIGIIAVSLLITAFFVARIYYTRYLRNSVRFNIIMPDGKIKKKRLKDIDKAVKVDGVRYLFDEKAIIQYKNTREIFYFYKHPQPIIYDKKKINPNSMSSTDIANIVDEEYSAKLFKTNNLVTKDYIIIGVLVVVGIVTLYSAYTINQGVGLSPESITAISEAVVNNIRGG